ncbi:hypothetical protein ACFH04_14970 [Streptomyces noboritoensis]|uniref:Uncharacterized protein n=1 Tax=Streptomyces noboritoensis TaxID=67337 RepID=A0ABV6TGT7_9ACTN
MHEHLYTPPREAVPRRRLCLAADVEQYSRLDTRAQSAVQADLVRALDEAATLTGLERAEWARQPQGDQEFAVLPKATPEATVLGPFVHHLAARLAVLNSRRTTTTCMRVRLAVDSGVVADAALGHAGPAPVAVARFVNAPQLKAALAAVLSTDLAVIVSDRLYQDVVRLGSNDLDPGQYVRVHIRVKEFGGYGWIHVPGHSPEEVCPPVEGADGPERAPATFLLGPETGLALFQYVHEGVAVGRDVTGGVAVGLPPHMHSGGRGRIR